MSKPNLFLAGVPKSGSSSLHFLLGQHPEICMIKVKEPYFYLNKTKFFLRKRLDGTMQRTIQFSREKYYEMFSKQDCKYYGESSIHYIYHYEGGQLIKKESPNSKFISY